MNIDEINTKSLMPVNEKFLDVFDTFMDEGQRTKIRANNVRQYVEGIVDLLLREKIITTLKPNEIYEGINWGRKIKIIKEHYDLEIGEKIHKVFKVGGDGSHFSGKVDSNELVEIIDTAIHIVEDIFVRYFLGTGHTFGEENIFTIFSMLPLRHRIYILEQLSTHYVNPHIGDRLSLAYVKSGDIDKAVRLLTKSFETRVIDEKFYSFQINKLRILNSNLDQLYTRNKNYEDNPELSVGIIDEDHVVIGVPTSKDVFETARAVGIFKKWFDISKDEYPEFINLFLYLMQTDDRYYE